MPQACTGSDSNARRDRTQHHLAKPVVLARGGGSRITKLTQPDGRRPPSAPSPAMRLDPVPLRNFWNAMRYRSSCLMVYCLGPCLIVSPTLLRPSYCQMVFHPSRTATALLRHSQRMQHHQQSAVVATVLFCNLLSCCLTVTVSPFAAFHHALATPSTSLCTRSLLSGRLTCPRCPSPRWRPALWPSIRRWVSRRTYALTGRVVLTVHQVTPSLQRQAQKTTQPCAASCTVTIAVPRRGFGAWRRSCCPGLQPQVSMARDTLAPPRTSSIALPAAFRHAHIRRPDLSVAGLPQRASTNFPAEKMDHRVLAVIHGSTTRFELRSKSVSVCLCLCLCASPSGFWTCRALSLSIYLSISLHIHYTNVDHSCITSAVHCG